MIARKFQQRCLFVFVFLIFFIHLSTAARPTLSGSLKLVPSTLIEENIIQKIPGCIEILTQFDFEQIPSVTPKIAELLVSQREAILTQLKSHHTLEEALQTIKGIGKVKSRVLKQHLRVCDSPLRK